VKLIKSFSLAVGVCVLSFNIAAFAQTATEPDLKVFNDALKLIHTHMIGLDKDGALDKKALQGLVNQLSPAVQLLNANQKKKEILNHQLMVFYVKHSFMILTFSRSGWVKLLQKLRRHFFLSSVKFPSQLS
jgi:hypothetical protein